MWRRSSGRMVTGTSEKGETIDKLLYGGYSTISLGYAGLCECTRYMKGVSHTDPDGTPFALEVMRHLNDACAKWKAEHNIDFSLYGTHWSLQLINLQSAYRNVLESFRVLQIRTTLQTAITYM